MHSTTSELPDFDNNTDILCSQEIIRAVFDYMDADGSGEVDVDEFRSLAHRLGDGIGDREAQVIFQSIDTDGSGSQGYWTCFVNFFLSGQLSSFLQVSLTCCE